MEVPDISSSLRHMRKNILLFVLITIIGLLLSPSVRGYDFTLRIPNPFDADTLPEIIDNLIGLIFAASIVLVALMVIVAGFLFVTAAGNPEKVAQAKKIITWALVGLFIVLLSKGISSLVNSLFEG